MILRGDLVKLTQYTSFGRCDSLFIIRLDNEWVI